MVDQVKKIVEVSFKIRIIKLLSPNFLFEKRILVAACYNKFANRVFHIPKSKSEIRS